MKGLARGGTPTHNLALSPEPQDSHSMQPDPKALCSLAWVSSRLVAQQWPCVWREGLAPPGYSLSKDPAKDSPAVTHRDVATTLLNCRHS